MVKNKKQNWMQQNYQKQINSHQIKATTEDILLGMYGLLPNSYPEENINKQKNHFYNKGD